MIAPREVEHRVLQVLDQIGAESRPAGAAPPGPTTVVSGSAGLTPALFAAWPRPAGAAARLLAAAANAARGRPLLWIVGVTAPLAIPPGRAAPKTGRPRPGRRRDGGARGVVGAAEGDFAGWWRGLQPFFDGLAPRVQVTAVPAGPGLPPVVALWIETDRAPFVLCPTPARREVPWPDDATGRVRTATRTELIKLLAPLAELPQCEVLEAELNLYRNLHVSAYARATYRWSVDASVYVLPRSDEQIILPLHRCRGAVEIVPASAARAREEPARYPGAAALSHNGQQAPGAALPSPLAAAGATAGPAAAPVPPADFSGAASQFSVTADKQSPGVRVTESAVLVESLGRFHVYLCGDTRCPQLAVDQPARLLLDLVPAGADRAVTLAVTLRPEPPTDANQAGRWKA